MTRNFRAWSLGTFAAASVILLAFPIATQLRGGTNKDYRLWYNVGQWVNRGEELYLRSDFGEPFPFLYPPFAAVLLAAPSLLGPLGCVVALAVATAAFTSSRLASCNWRATAPVVGL